MARLERRPRNQTEPNPQSPPRVGLDTRKARESSLWNAQTRSTRVVKRGNGLFSRRYRVCAPHTQSRSRSRAGRSDTYPRPERLEDINAISRFDEAAVGRIFREESGRSIAALIRAFGDIDLAEDDSPGGVRRRPAHMGTR